ncbi:type I iodothyronine deiodinase-like [Glandiceps talaboti]
MASFLEDRELVIKILKRYEELMFDEETVRVYNERLHPFKTDPSKLLGSLEGVWEDLSKQVLKENGIDPNLLTERLPSLVRRYYSNDKEVLGLLKYMSSHGSKCWIGDLKIGDTRPDVNLVAMETKEDILLSRLHAIVHSGSLHKLHQEYKDRVDFLYIYVLEAHPRDGWALGAHYSTHDQHRNMDERIAAARRLIEADSQYQTFTSNVEDEVKVRMVVDTMENVFAQTYAGQPDRAFIIEDDKMAFIGNIISIQCVNPEILMTDALREWLETRFAGK